LTARAERRTDRTSLRGPKPWVILLAGCALVLTVVDILPIARTTGLFTGGFLVDGPRRTPAEVAGFLVQSLILDGTLVLGAWLIALPILRRTRLLSLQRLSVAALVVLIPSFVFLYVRYNLARYFGKILDPALWLAISGGSTIEWFAQGEAQIAPVAISVAGMVVLGGFGVRALRPFARAVESRGGWDGPPTLALAAAFVVASGLSVGVLSNACAHGGTACDALENKASGAALLALFQRATDFDRDGYGAFAPLADPAPFDASRHPYALDIPGDGIDQNGLAGDHPAAYQPPPDQFVEHPVFGRRPSVLLVFLEGMRADIIGTKLGDKPVTPYLEKLSAEGGRSEHFYANSPYTARSRGQLMGGRLSPYPDQSTLVDDFHANGYDVAWISGEDESFGADESRMLGLARADYYFDARQDPKRSVSKYSTTGSLMVSWRRVNDEAASFLSKSADQRPLFLYVNYGDTHFPYDHRELDDLLGVPRLPSNEIRPENPSGVYATYANAAANVDRAIEELVARFRAKVGPDAVVIVTSDHGEALFEAGVLGHGLSLDTAQTRIPLIVAGLGGEWPEPAGLSDLRGMLQRSLAAEGERRPHFVPVPGRHILQYMAVIEKPRLLCLRGLDTELRYNTSDPAPADSEDFRQMIWWWESLQLERARSAGGE
jgi:sulfatase-like protein